MRDVRSSDEMWERSEACELSDTLLAEGERPLALLIMVEVVVVVGVGCCGGDGVGAAAADAGERDWMFFPLPSTRPPPSVLRDMVYGSMSAATGCIVSAREGRRRMRNGRGAGRGERSWRGCDEG